MRKARGGALAVYHRGELVVDIWTGFEDAESQRPWQAGTTAMSWSTTKGVTSALAHVLIERGLIELDRPIAEVWPEFACNGKRTITPRHVLAQEAGLHDIRHLLEDGNELLSHDRVAARIASATPAYEPGTANGYHALTYGYIIDELVRRTDGRTLAQAVTDEFATPLALTDFGLTMTDAAEFAPPPAFDPPPKGARSLAKTANLFTRLPPLRLDLASLAAAFLPRQGEVIGTPEFLASGNGSIGGVFTARSLAHFYSALIGDQRTTLWSSATLHTATRPHNHRRDKVLSVRPHWSLGFHRPWPRNEIGPEAFGFWGMYGSGAWADPQHHLAVALISPDSRALPLKSCSGTIAGIAANLA